MNKEQITFVATLLLLGLIFVLGGGSDEARSSRRRAGGKPPPSADEIAVVLKDGTYLPEDAVTWSAAGGNVFLAPRETRNLPKLELPAPPLPRLVHPGLPLVPRVGGTARASMRRVIVPDPSVALPAPGGASVFAEVPEVIEIFDPEAVEAEVDLENLTEPTLPLTLAERLRMTSEERDRRRQRQEELAQAEAERLRKLDRVIWTNGTVDHGTLLESVEGADRYDLKLLIDRLRGDVGLSEAERQAELGTISFVFMEDRGSDRAPGRVVINAATIAQVEFARTALNEFHLRRRQVRPDDLVAQLGLARLVFDDGHYAEAASQLEAMEQRGLASAESLALLADSWRLQRRYDKEFKTLERGIAAFPRSVRLLARQGRLLMVLGLPDQAEAPFRAALEIEPADALANLGLGAVLLERGELDEAVTRLRQGQTGTGLDPDSRLRGRTALGRAYALLGDLRNAEQQFNMAVDLDKGDPTARAGLASVSLARGSVAEALEIISRAREDHPLHGGLAYLDAVANLHQGNWVTARDLLLTAEELDPLLTDEVRTAMSFLQEQIGKDEASLAEADGALLADPTDIEAWVQRGRALLNVGDLQGAREAYERALSADPMRADTLVALGDTAFRAGQTAEALRFYDRAAALDADFPLLQGRRLVARVRARDLSGAKKIMGTMPVAEARDPFVEAAQAFYYYEEDTVREALQRLHRIAENEGAPPILRSYAGQTAAAVEDNLNRQVWEDAFNWTGTDLVKGWRKEIGAGLTVQGKDGKAIMRGRQALLSDRPTVLYQERSGRLFASFIADVELAPKAGVYGGIGLMAFSKTGRGAETWPGMQDRSDGTSGFAGIQVAIDPDGNLVHRVLRTGRMSDWLPVPGVSVQGGAVSLGIRVADPKAGLFDILVDHQPALTGIENRELGRWARPMELQAFVQAPIDTDVSMAVDNVEIVTFKQEVR